MMKFIKSFVWAFVAVAWLLLAFVAYKYYYDNTHAPCEELLDRKIKDLPARCLIKTGMQLYIINQ